ncbi:MAG: alanine racemase [Paracoccaceae bacterium]
MGTGRLTIDLGAVASNWRALDAMGPAETGAVVKADGYGLGAAAVARTLAGAGARSFFVATAQEGVTVRRALGPGPAIHVFSGHMRGDAADLREAALIPLLNDAAQVARHRAELPDAPYGVQLDSGMNRLGVEPQDWAAMRDGLTGADLVMSHLACADEPQHPMNQAQLRAFRDMTGGLETRRSLSATGGTLLGAEFAFDMVRPGIGLYGGRPFEDARAVVRLDLPVIQIRDVAAGETVGYGGAWTAPGPARIATVSGGYADGLLRALSNGPGLWAGDVRCPLVGRVSMDLITADVTAVEGDPEWLSILTPEQGIDVLADAAGTIGYELLTSLGARYARSFA